MRTYKKDIKKLFNKTYAAGPTRRAIASADRVKFTSLTGDGMFRTVKYTFALNAVELSCKAKNLKASV